MNENVVCRWNQKPAVLLKTSSPEVTPFFNDGMITSPAQRPEWAIDRVLTGLIGETIRVAAESFTPLRADGVAWPHAIACASLLLPDNSQPSGLPVFFEGKLLDFERQVGVVLVRLGALELAHPTAQGLVYFRGCSAVLLTGPACVRLASSLRIERLPTNEENYWSDLRLPQAQFALPLLGHNEV